MLLEKKEKIRKKKKERKKKKFNETICTKDDEI